MSKLALIHEARCFLEEEDGPTATEYAILLALLVLVAVATIGSIGSRVENIYAAINSASAAAGI